MRGTLVLTAGGIEIECVFPTDRIADARQSFDSRVFVDGVAHYDGESALPVRIDVTAITLAAEAPDLLRWRGAFQPKAGVAVDADDEW